jgi:hypothetical protein
MIISYRQRLLPRLDLDVLRSQGDAAIPQIDFETRIKLSGGVDGARLVVFDLQKYLVAQSIKRNDSKFSCKITSRVQKCVVHPI